MGYMRHLLREVEKAQNKPNARMRRAKEENSRNALSKFRLESTKKMPAMQNIPPAVRDSYARSIISKLRNLWRRNTR